MLSEVFLHSRIAMLKVNRLILPILLLCFGLSPPATAQENLAQILVSKSMAKLITADARRNLRIDIETVTEKYDIGNDQPKSIKTNRRTTDARLEVRGINIVELYQALQTRYDFYIDMDESTGTINGISCAIIKFAPKAGLRINKTADEFINRSEGAIYINIDDNFSLVRVHGFIIEPFRFTFSWFFIPLANVNVYQFEYSVDYTMYNNVLVEKTLNGLADYKILSRGKEKFTNNIYNYRPR